MKQIFLVKNETPCLVLFFTGWGMDATPFQECVPAGCDLMICYDYRSLDFDAGLLDGYSSVRLVGWSMGVWVASLVMKDLQVPIRKRIAINGTLFPVDDQRGIALSVFHLTINGLNTVSLHKFYRRMCGSSLVYDSFMRKLPQRSISDLKEELICIGAHYSSFSPSFFHWDLAVIGSKDRIFLSDNQKKAWPASTEIVCTDSAHYDAALFQLYLNRI